MKICFIWAKNFRNFDDIGLNLANDVKFTYDQKRNKISKKHLIQLPENFFGKNITEVTGMIGKNGTGKSNALELICKILKGGKSSLRTDFLAIIRNGNEYECIYNFNNDDIPATDFTIKFNKYEGSVNPLKVVFFSNVYDDRRNGFDKEISDISVNNLARTNSPNRTSDFVKQVIFIKSKIFKSLNIDVPTEVQISNRIWISKNSSSDYKYGDLFSALRKFYRDRTRDLKDSSRFINLLKYGFFLETFQKLTRTKNRYSPYDKVSEHLNDYLNTDDLYMYGTDELSDKLLNYLYLIVDETDYDRLQIFDEEEGMKEISSGRDLIIKQIEFLNDWHYKISDINPQNSTEGIRGRFAENFIFKYSSGIYKTFIDDFASLFDSCSFLDINWLGISSGHKAYLNLFSSIHSEIRFTRTPNLLLCIDEGDLYLHPRWQIEFFDKLLKVLPSIYSGNIQLILTSHSPFLLSDLPKQNITILKRDEIGYSLDGIDLDINTFGGNLYDLYAEPFFLGNRRTSDFAYDKIKYLIEKAESKTYTEKEKKDLLKLTNILGDEIIKFRINSLLKDND